MSAVVRSAARWPRRRAAIPLGRIVCLQRVTVNALESTTCGAEGFNRHGTQHGHPDAFSEASMLAGALLVAGWIRELSWLAEHRPEVFREE